VAHRVDLFCEDAAHESFARGLIRRLAVEEAVEVTTQVASARFGIPRLKRELRAYQRLMERKGGLPDLLVVVIDGNLVGVASRRREVEEVIDVSSFPRLVVGVPDPCVERWYLADPPSFAGRFGAVEHVAPGSGCDEWKQELEAALERAGEIVTAGGAEFAEDIVAVMDLYRAGRGERSLRSFADDLRAALKLLP
jgi:hypothetical protein